MKNPNGTNSVYKTAKGLWVAQIVVGKYENGNLKYKRFSSKKQSVVIQKMKDYKNKFGNTSNAETSYIDEYLLGYLQNVKKNVLKSTSYDRDINTHSIIKRYIGQYTIGELSAQLIQNELMNKLKDDGYSYSTTHKVYVLLNECLRYAVDNKRIDENPCTSVKQPPKSSFSAKEIRFLNEDEIEKFIKTATYLKPDGKPFYAYGFLCCLDIYTGLRCGELVALQWKDINFDGKYIDVHKTVSTTYEYNDKNEKAKRVVRCEETTKTEDGKRLVNLNTKSLKLLIQMKKMCGDDYNENYYLVTNSPNTRSVDVVSNLYSNICKTAQIDNPLGIHTLRHTFASLLIKKGVDIKIVSELLGHKDVAFTYNTYVHLIGEQKAKAVELLDLD